MLQNNSLISESNKCSLCYEVISNPLCPNCLGTQIDAWLTLYPNYHELKDALMPKLCSFIKKCKENSINCIKCKNAKVSVCPYCFTDLVLKELKKLEVHPIIIKEFLQFFNFKSEENRYNKLNTNLK